MRLSLKCAPLSFRSTPDYSSCQTGSPASALLLLLLLLLLLHYMLIIPGACANYLSELPSLLCLELTTLSLPASIVPDLTLLNSVSLYYYHDHDNHHVYSFS